MISGSAKRTIRRTTFVLVTTVALAAIVVFLTGPSAPRRTVAAGVSNSDRIIRGAFHIHTTRSDGALDKGEVAAAAARAGLQFAVFTDHGDGTRQPDPPEYLHGVLCIDGVEISTNDGHYVAIGMAAAPYPLGGDGVAVAEDVTRLGGFGIAAHPITARAELAWSDWESPIDGVEWLNADSEWRDESRWRLGRAVLDYFWRPSGALALLLDRPTGALRQWDQLTSLRKVAAVAGHDAHGGVGAETETRRGRRLHIPSYEASFRTFSLHAVLSRRLTQNPALDAEALLHAFRTGAIYTTVDAIAEPTALDFRATAGGLAVAMGEELPVSSGKAAFSVRAAVPAGATTILKRDGRNVAQSSGGALDYEDSSTGVYRVEVEVPGAPGTPPVPWLVSNPIYRRADVPLRQSQPIVSSVLPLMAERWRAETDPGSVASVALANESVSLIYRLKDPPESSQFAALVVDLRRVPADANVIFLRGSAAGPMRASAQLRFGQDGDEQRRWGSSVYLDSVEREIRLPFARLRYLDGEGKTEGRAPISQPPITRATSLLFVVDLTNSLPGAKGSFTLREVALAKN